MRPLLFDPEDLGPFLRAAARHRAPATYKETMEALGEDFMRWKVGHLCRALDDVDARTRGAGEPELAVLVVRQSDGLPGQGWWAGRVDWKGPWEGPEAQAHVRSLQEAAFAWWGAE
jgi:hypothetical protein